MGGCREESLDVVRSIMSVSGIPAKHKLVLVGLALDRGMGGETPAVPELAVYADMTEEEVEQSLKWLEDNAFIVRYEAFSMAPKAAE